MKRGWKGKKDTTQDAAFKETTETGLSQIRKEMLREISCNITRTMKGPTLRGNQLLDMHPSILSVER